MKSGGYEDRSKDDLAADLILHPLLKIHDLIIVLMIVEMIDLLVDLDLQIVNFFLKFKCEQLYPLIEE
jgi:hypothetical protein